MVRFHRHCPYIYCPYLLREDECKMRKGQCHYNRIFKASLRRIESTPSYDQIIAKYVTERDQFRHAGIGRRTTVTTNLFLFETKRNFL